MTKSSEKDAKLVKKTIHGAVWIYVSKYSAKFMVFVSTAILARLLTKEDFGVAGYAILALSFIDFIEGLGIRQALIYYREDDEQTNTGFWLGLGVGLGLFLISFFVISPLAGWFFKDERAVAVTRVLSFTMPLSSLRLVHNAMLEKKLSFRKKFFPEFASAVSKGVFSIILALVGLGAWSLIAGQLISVVVGVIIFGVIFPWRPTLSFRKKYVRPLLTYGTQIIYNSALSTLLINVDYLLVGRILGAAALGVYTLAFRIPQLLIKEFSGAMGSVIFPVYASLQDDLEALRRGFLLTMQYVNILTVPMGLGLALVAEPIILVIFGKKWIEGIPVMVAISIYSVLRAVVFNTGDVYKAMGRPELLVKIHIGQAIVSVPALIWATSMIGTLKAVAWTQVVLIFFAGVIKLVIATHILQTPFTSIFKALKPAFVGSVPMAVSVLIVLKLTYGTSPLIQLITSIVTGCLVYASALWILYRETTVQAIDAIKLALPRGLRKGKSV